MSRQHTIDTQTLALFNDPASDASTPCETAEVLAQLRSWSDAGTLRHLDAAMARWVVEHDPQAAPCTLMAVALLAHMEGKGHSCLPLQALLLDPGDVLGWDHEAQQHLQSLWMRLPVMLDAWVEALCACPLVRVAEQVPDQGQPLVLSLADPREPLLYLRRYWHHERQVAEHIRARSQGATDAIAAERLQPVLKQLFPAPGERCDWQKVACALALRGRFSVITGGPGTGKTHTAARLLALLFASAPDPDKLRVALAAPTGKAAARLKQSIDQALQSLRTSVGTMLDLDALVHRVGAARTLHSLLGARPGTRHWGFHAGRPLDVDVLIVDEASMIHLEMMVGLLEALPPTARLVLLGDKDQLASVEAGAVLGDLCRDAAQGAYAPETVERVRQLTGEQIPAEYVCRQTPPPALAQHIVMLRESHRFSGPIAELAQAVNREQVAQALDVLQRCESEQGWAKAQIAWREGCPFRDVRELALRGRGDAVGYGPYVDALKAWETLRRLSLTEQEHLAWVERVLDAFEQFRVLCAVREGEWGVAGINAAMEQWLRAEGLPVGEGEWYRGRPVMVTRNDAALGLSNGDIGIALPGLQSGLRVYFAGEKVRSFSVTRLSHVETAFAMTVHKSQGSEFPHTALVLSARGQAMLGRELVYTGITRAKKHFTLLSERPGLLAQAIRRPTRRASGLLRFLEGMMEA